MKDKLPELYILFYMDSSEPFLRSLLKADKSPKFENIESSLAWISELVYVTELVD